MPDCAAVAFTHTTAYRILTFFTSVCWHIISLSALKLRSVLTKVTYFDSGTIIRQIL